LNSEESSSRNHQPSVCEMELGLNLATAADSWKVVKRAEELGYTRAWFYDTHMLNADVFVAMAAAAMVTTRIRLGTGVLIPSNRIAPVAANALASMNALAPGRIDFGVSTGNTARSTMGLGPIKLADMERYIRIVTALLQHKTVEWEFEGLTRKIRFLSPEIGVINIRDPIPVHVSAAGPKGRRVTAALGAEWMLPGSSVANALSALEDMRNAWRDFGHDPRQRFASLIAGGCILSEGEPFDSPRAKAIAGPHAMSGLHGAVEVESLGFKRPPLPAKLAPVLEAYRHVYSDYEPSNARYLTNHRGHLMFLRSEEHQFCTADLIRERTFTGTASELLDRLRALRDGGFDHFSITIRHGHAEMLEEWAELFAKL
jgi:5,10-methylenetetrahydromethanopterin reductase